MRSVMAHQFSQVPVANIPRSAFDRSHGIKTTFNEQYIYPIYVDEALPGDTFTLDLHAFGRLATPIFPVMDNMYLDFFFFFVPYRLVWNNFVKFFGEQDNPTDSTSFLVPVTQVTYGASSAIALFADYFGIPAINTTLVGSFNVSSLPFRAYNLIWNQWFRDENIQTSALVDKSDGPDLPASFGLLPRGKRKDYFTSALPWPQKGPAVTLPLGSAAPVFTQATAWGSPSSNPLIWKTVTNTLPGAGAIGTDATGKAYYGGTTPGNVANVLPANLYADLGNATAATINQLRQAFQIQKIYERDARGGTRYTELIKSHFGVTSPDARLQRAEYLGGGSLPLNINPIAQTSGTGASGTSTPQGNLSAYGTVHTHRGGIGFSKSFTEHGVLLGLVNFRADINYQDGLDRMWTRQTRFDFYWPALSHIGEQGVRNDEIFVQGIPAVDSAIFGYQERYAEYRYKQSRVCGAFRSASPTPLDAWHLSQHFAALPTLSPAFIQDTPPVSRIVAVPTQPRILLDVYFKLRCARPMPVYGVPGLIDHF